MWKKGQVFRKILRYREIGGYVMFKVKRMDGSRSIVREDAFQSKEDRELLENFKLKETGQTYNSGQYEVERILRRRQVGARHMYLVRWKGFPHPLWNTEFTRKQLIRAKYGELLNNSHRLEVLESDDDGAGQAEWEDEDEDEEEEDEENEEDEEDEVMDSADEEVQGNVEDNAMDFDEAPLPERRLSTSPVQDRRLPTAPVESQPLPMAPVQSGPTASARNRVSPTVTGPNTILPTRPVEERRLLAAPVEVKPARMAPVEERRPPTVPAQSRALPPAAVAVQPSRTAPVEDRRPIADPAPTAPVERRPLPMAPVHTPTSPPAPVQTPTSPPAQERNRISQTAPVQQRALPTTPAQGIVAPTAPHPDRRSPLGPGRERTAPTAPVQVVQPEESQAEGAWLAKSKHCCCTHLATVDSSGQPYTTWNLAVIAHQSGWCTCGRCECFYTLYHQDIFAMPSILLNSIIPHPCRAPGLKEGSKKAQELLEEHLTQKKYLEIAEQLVEAKWIRSQQRQLASVQTPTSPPTPERNQTSPTAPVQQRALPTTQAQGTAAPTAPDADRRSQLASGGERTTTTAPRSDRRSTMASNRERTPSPTLPFRVFQPKRISGAWFAPSKQCRCTQMNSVAASGRSSSTWDLALTARRTGVCRCGRCDCFWSLYHKEPRSMPPVLLDSIIPHPREVPDLVVGSQEAQRFLEAHLKQKEAIKAAEKIVEMKWRDHLHNQGIAFH